MSVDVALHSLEYLDTEKDYVPWAAAMRELGYLSDMLRETEVFGDYQVCFDHISINSTNKIGTPPPTTTKPKRSLPTMLASAKNSPCHL